MGKTVIDITPTRLESPKKKKVAAYARVSYDKDTMLHSLAAQIDYFHHRITSNPDWEFAGVFADEAKTGTKNERPQLKLLLEACDEGRVEMVLVKSISRFARNTVDLLNITRLLCDKGIEVFFEENNLSTLGEKGELLLTLLAATAQAESLPCSENCRWRVRKNYEEGRSTGFSMMGYRLVDGEIIIEPDEAQTVRRFFDLYLEGAGQLKITKTLNEEGYRTRHGNEWSPTAIRNILTNEKYAGDLLLQKSFITDHLTKRKQRNNGELPQFFVEDDHEATVSRDAFDTAQKQIEQHAVLYYHGLDDYTVFTGKVRCGICGKNFRRKTTRYRIVWCCNTYNTKGKRYCAFKVIPEETLQRVSAKVMGVTEFDPQAFEETITSIDALPGNRLIFHMANGQECEEVWIDRSRRESWTDEMRDVARRREIERRKSS